MATIPRVVAQRSLEPGGVVQFPTGDAVGSALEQAGKTGVSVAATAMERSLRADRFDATVGLSNFQARTATDLQLETQNNLQPGAKNFSRDFVTSYDKKASEFLSTVPETVRPEVAARLDTQRESVIQQAGAIEFKERQRYEVQTVTDRLGGAKNTLLQNPDLLPHWMRDINETIDMGTLTPIAKDALKYQAKVELQTASIEGKVMVDPSGARRALGFPGGSVVDRIIGAESEGNPTAINPNSSATGSGQFIKSTWLDTVQAHEPELMQGRTKAEVLALRNNPAISRRMTAYLTEDNRQALTNAGVPVTDGTLYLAHFSGAAGAINVLKNGDKSARELLGADAVAANPFLASMTGRDVAAWAAGKMAGKPDPQYADIPFQKRAELGRRADVVDAQLRFDTEQQVKDDLQSVLQTGQGRQVSPDAVITNLGPAKYKEWQSKRQAAQSIWTVTNDMPQVPDDVLQARVNSLQPKPGEDGFSSKQQVFEAAQAKASDLIAMRRNDPARSVLEIPEVRDAVRARNPAQPETVQRAVTISLAAQTAAGIPTSVQSPISRDDAKTLAAPLVAVSRVTSRDNVSPDERKVLEGVVREVQRQYGPYAEQVLPHVIEEGIKDRQFGPLATSIFKKMAKGESVTAGDRSAIEAATDASNATIATTSPSAKPQGPTPTYRAIQLLLSKPELAPQFNQKYGNGTADRYLQGRPQ